MGRERSLDAEDVEPRDKDEDGKGRQQPCGSGEHRSASPPWSSTALRPHGEGPTTENGEMPETISAIFVVREARSVIPLSRGRLAWA